MAIDKSVENEYGADFTYHKLRDVRITNDDKSGIQLTLTVHSWLNKQARIDGKMPTVRQCIIMNADFAMTPFYALLKAKFEEFSGGIDDFNNEFKEAKLPQGAAEHPAVPEYTVQTPQGQLIKRWKESPKVQETAQPDTPPDEQPAPEQETQSPESEAPAQPDTPPESQNPVTGEADNATGEADNATGEGDNATGEADNATGEADNATGEADNAEEAESLEENGTAESPQSDDDENEITE